MEASIVAAWWGAIAGSAAVVWDIIKWTKSGPKLLLSASINMEYFNQGKGYDGILRVLLNVRNVGDKPTTITHFLGFAYKSKFNRLRNKPAKQFVIMTGLESKIPCILGPGETWSACALQSEFEKFFPSAPFVYIGVQHSMAEKPACILVNLKKTS